MTFNIPLQRLASQQIARHPFKRPAELVAHLGAIQAQDYPGAKWSIGLRLPGATEAEVDRAIADKSIVRTWPMRGTLHFVASADIHWMRALLTPRIIAGSARRHQQLELSVAIFAKCEKILLKALRGGKQLSREAMCALLEKNGIPASGPRAYHIPWRLAQEGVLCFGAHEGKQPTFTLLDEWAPATKSRDRDESLAELTKRYFMGHGPATLRDFVWWSGLKMSDAKAGMAMVASKLAQEKMGNETYWMSRDLPALPGHSPTAYLLPGFDEYLLGYTDRSAVLDPKHAQKICPGSNGMFIPTMVIDGRVAGTWKRAFKKSGAVITPSPFKSLSKVEKVALAAAAEPYGKFVGKTATIT